MTARGVSFRFGAKDEVTDTAKNSPHDQSPEQSGKLLHFFKGNKVRPCAIVGIPMDSHDVTSSH